MKRLFAKLAAYLASFRVDVDDNFAKVLEGQRIILERLERIEILVTPPPLPPTPPAITDWHVVSERESIGDDETMRKLLTYKAGLPVVPTTGTPNFDVNRQRVRVEVEGVETDNQVLPILAQEVTFEVESAKNVGLFRTLLDDDDLESETPATQTFVSKGNIKPTAPGDFGAIEVLAEREVPDA